MTKVFIGGSRRLSCLSAAVRRRIDSIVGKRFTVLIGDANGADKAVQQYLAGQGYQNVIVFCMADNCRNNIGGWPTRNIPAAKGTHGFAYYATKDRAMADHASHGLMLWDGDSKGTLNSIINLVRQRKPAVVYFAPTKTFQTIRSAGDITELFSKCDRASVQRLERELAIPGALYDLALFP